MNVLRRARQLMNSCGARGARGCGGAIVLLVLASCSKPASSGAADATIPVPAFSATFTTAANLAVPVSEDYSADYQITDMEVVPAPLVFANYRNDALAIRTPMILRCAETWKIVLLPAFHHAEWVYAGAAIGRGELWAILHSTSDARAMGLYFLRSTDDGVTWTLFSGLKFPVPSMEFFSFSLKADGTGSVTVHQEEDTALLPRGMYVYRTSDGGKSWSGPTFTADDLVTADQSNGNLPEILNGIHPLPAPAVRPVPATRPSIFRSFRPFGR
jgi:hypothetical protein